MSGHLDFVVLDPVKPLKEIYNAIGSWPSDGQHPIVYHGKSNINFFGLESWNRFDAWKLDRVYQRLLQDGYVDDTPPSPHTEATMELLSLVHSSEYLQQLQESKMTVMRMTELPGLFLLPNFLIQRQILTPLKFQAAGTVLAAGMALEHGWAIHIGGGMVHASHDNGAGWSPYDDLTLAIHFARSHTNRVRKAMIIDLGAHQGNGYQNNKLFFQDEDLFIVDVFNESLFPHDENARKAINVQRTLGCGTTSEAYMEAVESALAEAKGFHPDLILYAAGTDVLEEDSGGRFRVTRQDVYKRDQIVFQFAKESDAPICMVLSSGYAKTNFEVVAESIEQLVLSLSPS